MGSKIQVTAGNVKIGGGAKVSVQSMLNIPSTDIEGSVRQAKELEEAGCEIIRAAIPNKDAVKLIPALKEAVSVPIVADIHFDYKLALEACAAGIDKIRINPGNIGSDDRVKAVADACRQRGIPIRIGVNSGSLEKEILAKYGHPTPEALCDSALYHASLLEKFDFNDIGKRMPYTMPAETFGEIEANVLATLNKDLQAKRKRQILRWSSIGGIAAAASVALLLMIKPLSAVQNDPLTQIDLAFGNLSEADQEYLVEIYHEDFFLNQIQ